MSTPTNINQQLNQIFTCQICKKKKYFKDPVTLPCGTNVCNEHVVLIENAENQPLFYTCKCQICSQDHLSNQAVFSTNIGIAELLKLNLHLDDLTKKEEELIGELELVAQDLTLLCNDPYNYIFDQLNEVRNRIDLRRENLIEKVHLMLDEALKKINAFEEECKINLNNLNNFFFFFFFVYQLLLALLDIYLNRLILRIK